VGAAALAGASGAAAATRIDAYPALYPAFSPKVSDYVSRCHRGRPLLLSVHATPATRVRVGRRKPSSGSARQRLALAAGRAVDVRIGSGRRRATYHVRCLPKDFPKWTSERRGRPQASFYVVTPAEGTDGVPYVAIFDTRGVPVWWLRTGFKPIDAKLLPDGNLAWSRFGDTPFASVAAPYEERRLDGTLVRRIGAVGVNTDFHDLQVMPNGDHLFLSYVPRDGTVDLSPYGGPKDATVLDGVAQEVSPDGRLVWSWNSKDRVETSESGPAMKTLLRAPVKLPDGRTAYDLVHVNSIEPAGGSVLVSLAFTDAVYRVTRATGAVEWKLGGTRRGESLKVPGEPEGSFLFSLQHDARLLSDGTVALHDNRSLSELGPRAVRFRIDEAARTATLIEQVADPQVAQALCCGSARRLPGGDWVASWGFNPLVEELSPAGKVVFALRFRADLFSYRAVPVRAPALTASGLRRGMDAMHGG
jgi:hypothetical protein